MARKLEIFEVHCRGSKYARAYNLTYLGLTNYEGARTHLIFRCNRCNLLWSTSPYYSIPKSKGCTKCRKDEVGKGLADTVASFITKARKVHDSVYDYSLITTYKNAHEPLTIICPAHGEFVQKGNGHLSGKGCPTCAKSKRIKAKSVKFEDFVVRSRSVHGNLYEYDKNSYTKGNTYVNIVCEVHGIFKQNCFNHLNGNGCPSCASYGYDINKPANIYCVVWSRGNKSFVKVGISNNPSSERIGKQSNKSDYLPYVINTYKHKCGKLVEDLEKEIKGSFSSGVVSKEIFPDGFTETFHLRDYKGILSLIKTRMEH